MLGVVVSQSLCSVWDGQGAATVRYSGDYSAEPVLLHFRFRRRKTMAADGPGTMPSIYTVIPPPAVTFLIFGGCGHRTHKKTFLNFYFNPFRARRRSPFLS